MLDQLAPELSQLKALAVGTLMGTVREIVVEATPKSVGEPVAKIIDSITEKIGGTPLDDLTSRR